MTTNRAPVIMRMLLLAALLYADASGAAADEDYFARRDSITAGVGNSVAHNIAVQTINPWPPYVVNDRINIDGRRIQLGMRRYQANKSIPPRGFSTSSSNFNGLAPSQSDTGLSSDYGANPGASPDNK
jgi:hypothetical protein